MKYKNEAGQIELDCNLFFSKNALDIYRECNKKEFKSNINIYEIFYLCLREIYFAHNQSFNPFIINIPKLRFNSNNNVLLAFSGGLDSMYQALKLRENNYNVTLFHCRNMNYYTNGKEYQVCEEFSKKYNFSIVYSTFKQNTRKDNCYKKYWKENSFKNMLLYSMMLDYCLEKNIGNISCGDDLRLNINNAVVGTNIADAKEVTIPFKNAIEINHNISFIFLDDKVNKAERIKLIQKYEAMDIFYSCVNPGKFNQYNHNRIEQKFNVKLEKYNCGVCRKCAFHSLLRHYFLNEQFNKEFIDFCWSKIAIGADNVFFNQQIPLNIRIQNLKNY